MTAASTPNLDAPTDPRDTPARTSANALSSAKIDTHGRLPRLTLEVHVTSTDTTATPTDREREIARKLYLAARDGSGKKAIALAAQALADQRAKYDRLADELSDEAERLADADEGAIAEAYGSLSGRIRQVAQQ